MIALINHHCQHCPGFNDIQEYQLHYLNDTIECWVVIPAYAIEQNKLHTAEQEYKKALQVLDSINQVRILLSV